MTDQDNDCRAAQQHPTHMCTLFKKGLMMEIDRNSSRPTAVCARCGAKADRAASLCQPKLL